jgi:3,4-dihydroxy 2-butanone 4-phosphate synthase/GTP cyclohydrolase II
VVNFMATHALGIVSVALLPNQVSRLGLSLQSTESSNERERYTVSIEARDEVSTGISAADRAHTIRVAADYHSRVEQLVTPGHIFPAVAEVEGLLRRRGWAEASIDLARIAGMRPVAAFCHVLDADGEIPSPETLEVFAEQHGLPRVSIDELRDHRMGTESFVSLLTQATLPTAHGDFLCRVFRDERDGVQHMALSLGEIRTPEPVLVRVHSECLTGDVLGSLRCDCGNQLNTALEQIAAEGRGVVVYLRQEGRGIGLVNKSRAYALQDEGRDTVEANLDLGLPVDARDYGVAAQMLMNIGVRRTRLLTNNPVKVESMTRYGLDVVARENLEVEPCEHNARYLRAKREKLGHLLEKV